MIELYGEPIWNENGETTIVINYMQYYKYGMLQVYPKSYCFEINKTDFEKIGIHHRFVILETALPGQEKTTVAGMIIGFLPADSRYMHAEKIRHVKKNKRETKAWNNWKKLRQAGKIGPVINGKIEKDIKYI